MVQHRIWLLWKNQYSAADWVSSLWTSYILSIEQTLPELCSVMVWVHFSFPSQNCAGHFLEATGERTHYQGQCGAAAVPGLWEVGVSVCECVHVCLSVCLSVSVCTCVFVCLSVCECVHVCVCLSVCLWQCGAATVPGMREVCVSVCLWVCARGFVCLSVCDNVEQLQCQDCERCVCLSVSLWVCARVFVCLSVCESVTMWSSCSARIVRGVCVSVCLRVCAHVCLFVCVYWVPYSSCVCIVHPAGPHLLQCRKFGEEHSTPTSCTAREGSSCSSMVCVHSCCEMTKQLG